MPILGLILRIFDFPPSPIFILLPFIRPPILGNSKCVQMAFPPCLGKLEALLGFSGLL